MAGWDIALTASWDIARMARRDTARRLKVCKLVGLIGMALAVLWLAPLKAFAIPMPTRANPVDPGWTPVAGTAYSMTAIVSVEVGGIPANDPADKIAAFVGSEVRGVASPTNLGGKWIFFLSIGADAANEALTFSFYDASADAVLPICEGLNFRADAVRGSIDSPYVLHESNPSAGACALLWEVSDGFSGSMSILAAVQIGGTRTNDSGDRVVALVGNEVRGVGVPFDVSGEQVYQIETWGDVDGEVLHFVVYDQSNGAQLDASSTAYFARGSTLGTPGNPYTISTEVTLPVLIESFTAALDENRPVLTWSLAESDDSIVGVDIEHATVDNGQFWEPWESIRYEPSPSARQTVVLQALPPGRHRFRIGTLLISGTTVYSREVELTVALPERIFLSQPFPNPTRTQAHLTLRVFHPEPVRAVLYDALGRQISILFDDVARDNTSYPIVVDAGTMAAGAYTIVVTGTSSRTQRSLIVVN